MRGAFELGTFCMKNILLKLFVVLSFLLPTAAFAQLGSSDTGLGTTAKEGYGLASTSITMTLPQFVGTYVIRPALGLTGTLLFALMTYAGFLWVTAQGDSKKVQKAKDILTQCVVGTVILVGAYAIANFVVTSLSTTTAGGG